MTLAKKQGSVMLWRYSVKGIKIQLSTGCLIFLCAYEIFDPYGSFWYFLLSATLHEGGHLLALWILRKKVTGITGSATAMEIHTGPLSYKEEFLIAGAGPAVNLILLLLSKDRLPVMTLINALLLWYNLLPMYPYDGGRMLRSSLRSHLPLSLSDTIEQIIGLCTFSLLFVGAMYLSFGLHSGIWPFLFCGSLFYRVGDVIFPYKTGNPCISKNSS